MLGEALAKIAIRRHHAIVEGICVREVLTRLGVAPGISIYVKDLGGSGIWFAGEDFDPAKDVEEVLDELATFNEKMPSEIGGGKREVASADEEIIRYHHRYRPHLISDAIFERLREAGTH